MSNSYTDKYEILKTFKKDELQTVLIGSNKEKSKEVVVINIFNKDKTSKFLSKSQFPKGLNNLVHLEDQDNELIVITEYREGTPLDSYLSYFNTTLKHKINLAYEYMTKIVKYDTFQSHIKKVLIDESQVNISNDELFFNELLFLDENVSDPTDFNTIALKIGTVIEKIIFTNESTDEQNNDSTLKKISNFINKLKNGEHNFNSIQGVYDAFRRIYIYDLFMDDESMSPSEENESLKSDHKDNLDTKIIGHNEIVNTVDRINTHQTNKDENSNIEEVESAKDIEDNISDDVSDDINDSSKDEDKPIMDSSENLIGNEESEDDFDDYSPKRNGNNFKVAIGAILLAILLVALLYKPVLNAFKPATESTAPEINAYFEYNRDPSDIYYFQDKSKISGKDNEIIELSWTIYKGDTSIREIRNKTSLKIKFEGEGQYKVFLKLKDKYGNVDEYSEIISKNEIELDELKNNESTVEKLDNLDVNYSNNSIVKDYRVFRSGNHSLQIGKDGENNSEKIIIDNINIKDNPTISMWIAANQKEEIQISAKGYKNNKLQFEKELSFTPKESKSWEMVEFSDTSNNIDKIELTFKGFTSPIWIDDIEISSYK